MARRVLGDGCLVKILQQYVGQKHYLACTAKCCWNSCVHCLSAPMVMLVHRDNICAYNIRTGNVAKRVELKVSRSGKRSLKAHDFTATFCDGVLYMFGGCWGNRSSMTEVAKFNLEEYTWSWGRAMPTSRSAACAVTTRATIYVIGGRTGEMEPIYDDIDTVEKYDTLENDWAPAPPLNRPRAYCSAVVVGSSLYVLGGCTSLFIEKLDLSEPYVWEDLPAKMPIMRHSSCVSLAMNRKIYVLGGWNRYGQNIARSGSVLDLETCTWAKLPRLPVDHDYFSQACAMDGSIYLFGASGTGGVSKYEPQTRRWFSLPSCKAGREGCYLAHLVGEPSYSSRIRPFQEDDNQPLPLPVHQTLDAVIQDVQHLDEAVEMDPAVAAAVVAETWAQQVELNLGAGSDDQQAPGLLVKLLLLTFSRHPAEFHTALLEGPEMQRCREQMEGLPCRLDCGALVFVEPFQYSVAIEAALREAGNLAVHHVVTSERFEPNIMQAVRGLKSRLNVRVRGKQTILQPIEVQTVRTFLDVPERTLRSIASVTHSTTDAHGGRNPRIL